MGSSAGDYSHPKLARTEVVRVAAAAYCDPRCVVRYLRRMHDGDDRPLKPSTVARVERALAKCGHADLVAAPSNGHAAARSDDRARGTK